MSSTSKSLRGRQLVAIPVLVAGVLLMAGAEWRRTHVFDATAQIAPPDVPALCRSVGVESLEQLSAAQSAQLLDRFADQVHQDAAGTARRLYAAASLEVAGAVLCLLGVIPLVLKRRPASAFDVETLKETGVVPGRQGDVTDKIAEIARRSDRPGPYERAADLRDVIGLPDAHSHTKSLEELGESPVRMGRVKPAAE